MGVASSSKFAILIPGSIPARLWPTSDCWIVGKPQKSETLILFKFFDGGVQ